jgi:hypothetical protein
MGVFNTLAAVDRPPPLVVMHFASFALLSLLALAARALALPMRRQAQSPPKLVVAHVIVGNTYGFTRDTWTADIQLAQSAGIDGFSLNVGADSWQSARVADACVAPCSPDIEITC